MAMRDEDRIHRQATLKDFGNDSMRNAETKGCINNDGSLFDVNDCDVLVNATFTEIEDFDLKVFSAFRNADL